MIAALEEIKTFWDLDKNSYLFLAILLLVFYLPRVHGIDLGSVFTVLVACFGFYFRIINIKLIKINKYEVFFICLVFFELFCLLIKPEVTFKQDSYYLLRLIRTTSLMYVFFLASQYFKLTTNQIYKLLLIALLGHLVLVYLQYFSSGNLKIFFLNLNPINDPNVNLLEFNETMVKGMRVKGAMNGFDGAGLIIALIFGLSLISFRKLASRLIFFFLCFLGTLITSRTGLVILVFIGLIFLLKILLENRKLFMKTFIFGTSFVLVSGFLVINFFPNSVFVEKTLKNSFELYYTYRETGKIKSNSFEDMIKNHYIISEKDMRIFGFPEKQVYRPDGKILSASQSDIGYLQLLANFGLPVFFVIVIFHLYSIKLLFGENHTIFDTRIILILAFLFACFKGPYFFGRLNYDIICLIFFNLGFKDDKKNFLI